MLRLFVAVEVPDVVKRSVAAAIEPWRHLFPSARWIPPANWHITLKFLGATDPGLVRWIEETVGAVASANAPVRTRLAHLGSFPTAGRARILWVGVDESADRLVALVTDLEAALAKEIQVESRRFHPHLTVARSELPLRLPDGFAKTSFSAGPFNVEKVVLFQSHLQRPRPRYEALRSFPLGR